MQVKAFMQKFIGSMFHFNGIYPHVFNIQLHNWKNVKNWKYTNFIGKYHEHMSFKYHLQIMQICISLNIIQIG